MGNSIIRTYTVTITKEIRVELPAEFGEQSFIEEWSKGLWPIESVDDIAEHAADMAAKGFSGVEVDGLGLLGPHYSKWPRVPDVKFEELSEETEIERIYCHAG